jgi:hypothetical protein
MFDLNKIYFLKYFVNSKKTTMSILKKILFLKYFENVKNIDLNINIIFKIFYEYTIAPWDLISNTAS